MSKMEFSLKGKNGQVYLFPDGSVTVERRGWFGFLYQLLSRGVQSFYLRDITGVYVKRPGAMRGYLKISGNEGNAVVWLTNNKMYDQAEAIRTRLQERLDARRLRAANREDAG